MSRVLTAMTNELHALNGTNLITAEMRDVISPPLNLPVVAIKVSK